jgi:DNA polymerase III alpha subunit
MAKYCDLHTHSNFSDGTNTPQELIRLAEEAGLSAVALTDHNTVEGLPEFLWAAEHSPAEAIAGIEISVDHRNPELHLIGMFLQPRHFDPIRALLEDGNHPVLAFDHIAVLCQRTEHIGHSDHISGVFRIQELEAVLIGHDVQSNQVQDQIQLILMQFHFFLLSLYRD